jgi:hypothetical protein
LFIAAANLEARTRRVDSTPRPSPIGQTALALQIRSWLADTVGCGSDDLRFAGSDVRSADNVLVRFTLDGRPGYAVQIRERVSLVRRRIWELTAEWPAGSKTTTVQEEPDW